MAVLNRPEGVVPSEPGVQLLITILRGAYSQLMETIATGDIVSREAQIEKAAQIESIASELDIDVRSWVAVEVPAFYEIGMFETLKGLKERGSNVLFDVSFANFHEEAIEAIVQETYANIAQGMTGITRTGTRLISMARREAVLIEIAKGDITGKDRKTIAKRIADTFAEDGITALTDRGGKQWDLQRYGEMLARTKLTQAHNTGTVNRMVESGYDLVEVSEHAGSCPLCAPFQGQVLSVTGRTSGYGSLDDAVGQGLFHPNCRHTITPYHQAYLDKAKVWDAGKQEYVDYSELRGTGSQSFSAALAQHNETIAEIGLTSSKQFNQYLESGDTKKASNFVARLSDDDPLKPSMQRLLGFMR